jgi:hypothetical protein
VAFLLALALIVIVIAINVVLVPGTSCRTWACRQPGTAVKRAPEIRFCRRFQVKVGRCVGTASKPLMVGKIVRAQEWEELWLQS